jgi:hypothetical protein
VALHCCWYRLPYLTFQKLIYRTFKPETFKANSPWPTWDSFVRSQFNPVLFQTWIPQPLWYSILSRDMILPQCSRVCHGDDATCFSSSGQGWARRRKLVGPFLSHWVPTELPCSLDAGAGQVALPGCDPMQDRLWLHHLPVTLLWPSYSYR